MTATGAVMWRWRSNPLRRTSDTVEAWTGLLLALLLLLAAPLACVMAVQTTYHRGQATADNQRESRHPVQATLIESAPAANLHAERGAVGTKGKAAVRWSTQGSERTGIAIVAAGSPSGTVTTIWVDRHDRVTSAPLDSTDVAARSAGAGFAAIAGVILSVLGIRVSVGRMCFRRRLTEWDRAWADTEPQWAHRA
ncbi:Rv1733c family protein [Streptomyces beijiangensis]|uniref:Uncharacterized protein n=1 Tax=Streptomyces beijiangensis TaxID=163361 RepID=A0A939F9A5_9ACTN|nr:hypothetical protein [Streptomyces beijiangensis]MBO0513297.1 hypothetical protein [Streptomyces beijiangensis]